LVGDKYSHFCRCDVRATARARQHTWSTDSKVDLMLLIWIHFDSVTENWGPSLVCVRAANEQGVLAASATTRFRVLMSPSTFRTYPERVRRALDLLLIVARSHGRPSARGQRPRGEHCEPPLRSGRS